MEIHRVDNLEAYHSLRNNYKEALCSLSKLETELFNTFQQHGQLYMEGFSWPIQQKSKFLIDGRYAVQDQINWRERLVCQKTQFNNRIRGAIHVFNQWYQADPASSIYLTEQHTVLYRWFKRNFNQVQGSEYLSESTWFNRLKFKIRLFPERLMHQDLTQLKFSNDQFNHILSFDCFEHIPNYQQAFRELFRVLKPGGKMMFSVPFDLNAPATLIRAKVDDNGLVEHLVKPEYHGNPVSKQGSLSYYTFGWDLLDVLNKAGFKQAYTVFYWSEKYAYLGGEQMLICAEA